MRISDWSSDVCSSDLIERFDAAIERQQRVDFKRDQIRTERQRRVADRGDDLRQRGAIDGRRAAEAVEQRTATQLAQHLQRDRKSVVSGKSVSVRVDLGGRRIIKKQKIKIHSDT